MGWNTRKNFLALPALVLAVLLPSRVGRAGEAEGDWTDHLQSVEGLYAFRADAENRRLLLMKADNHAAPRGLSLRIRLQRAGIQPLVVNLHPARGDGPPWRYGAEAQGWDGQCDTAELETSEDGKSWTGIGTFHRPRD